MRARKFPEKMRGAFLARTRLHEKNMTRTKSVCRCPLLPPRLPQLPSPCRERRKSHTVRAQASPNTGNWPYFAARAARAPKRSDTTKQNDENRTAHLQLIVASEPPRACSRSNVLAIPPALRGCEKSRGPRVLQTGSGSPATRIALEKSAAAFRLRPAAARSARVSKLC